MPGLAGVEAVLAQMLLTLQQFEVAVARNEIDEALHGADGAVAA